MTHKIEPYMFSFEEIPTKLVLNIDDRKYQAIYRRCENKFSYIFEIFVWQANVINSDEIKEIIQQISKIMCGQSYDHGSEWRTINIKEIEIGNTSAIFEIEFRIKDSY